MKNLAILTSTRAEYGLLYPVIKKFREHEDSGFRCSLIVTGTHLSGRHGYTINEIHLDNIRVDFEVKCEVDSSSELDIAHNMADTIEKFSDCFIKNGFDTVVVLGDRYEIMAVAIAAMLCHIPVFHIGGGDTTEGAIDESIRHSITKMSYLHFPSNEQSRKRIIQMGEDQERVFNVGSTSIDNILNEKLMSKNEVLASIGLDDCNYILCTFHPETIDNSGLDEVKNLIDILRRLNYEVIITKANSDLGGEAINTLLDEADKKYENIHVYASLGRIRYLSLMKYAKCVVGNSSSGIIETPALHVPTVNIGNRQRGRLRAESVFDCSTEMEDIKKNLDFALSEKGQEIAKNCHNPYGDGNAAQRIVDISLDAFNRKIDLKKHFYNISTEETV